MRLFRDASRQGCDVFYRGRDANVPKIDSASLKLPSLHKISALLICDCWTRWGLYSGSFLTGFLEAHRATLCVPWDARSLYDLLHSLSPRTKRFVASNLQSTTARMQPIWSKDDACTRLWRSAPGAWQKSCVICTFVTFKYRRGKKINTILLIFIFAHNSQTHARGGTTPSGQHSLARAWPNDRNRQSFQTSTDRILLSAIQSTRTRVSFKDGYAHLDSFADVVVLNRSPFRPKRYWRFLFRPWVQVATNNKTMPRYAHNAMMRCGE